MKKILYPTLALGFLLITTVLLVLPGSSFPKENWFSRIWFDKWVHLGMFMIMVILWCLAIYKNSDQTKNLSTHFVLVMIFTILYGVGMELVQKYLVAHRSFDIGDIIADAAGAVIGWLICRRRYIKK